MSGIFNQIITTNNILIVVGYVENSESDPSNFPIKCLWKTCGNVYVFCGKLVEIWWKNRKH